MRRSFRLILIVQNTIRKGRTTLDKITHSAPPRAPGFRRIHPVVWGVLKGLAAAGLVALGYAAAAWLHTVAPGL